MEKLIWFGSYISLSCMLVRFVVIWATYLNCRNKLMFILWISDSGVSLENGIFVAAVVPGSPAAKEGSLTVGDRIIAVSLNTFLWFVFIYLFLTYKLLWNKMWLPWKYNCIKSNVIKQVLLNCISTRNKNIWETKLLVENR